jgi:hypothetical protein
MENGCGERGVMTYYFSTVLNGKMPMEISLLVERIRTEIEKACGTVCLTRIRIHGSLSWKRA